MQMSSAAVYTTWTLGKLKEICDSDRASAAEAKEDF